MKQICAWGTPSSSNCPLNTHFRMHMIILEVVPITTNVKNASVNSYFWQLTCAPGNNINVFWRGQICHLVLLSVTKKCSAMSRMVSNAFSIPVTHISNTQWQNLGGCQWMKTSSLHTFTVHASWSGGHKFVSNHFLKFYKPFFVRSTGQSFYWGLFFSSFFLK